MRSRVAVSIALAWLVLAEGAPVARGAITTPYESEGATSLADGVRHEWGTLVTESTQYVNVLEIDQSRAGVGVRLSQAEGIATRRRTIVDQALAYDADEREVVATINGSTFFYQYAPDGEPGATGQGLNISDGELINAGAPVSNAAILAFGIDAAGGARIGDPRLEMSLTLPDATEVSVDRVNQKRPVTDVVVFTPRFDTHTWTDTAGDEYVIEGFRLPLSATGSYSGTVVEVRYGQGDTLIGPGQTIVSVAHGSPAAAAMAALEIGDPVSFTTAVSEDWQGVVNSVGGRNPLVDDGVNVAVGTTRHPRIAVGIRPDGSLLMVAVDNGDLDAGGMTLPDVAELMIDLGAVDAVNLDGGNSSQMAVRRGDSGALAYVNGHLEAASKYLPVSNALQVVSDAPAVDAAAPVVGEPRISLAPVARVAKKAAALEVAWSATDDSTVDAFEAEMQLGGGDWVALTPSGSPAAASAALQVPFGMAVSVRVRATDRWGNTSQWRVSAGVRVVIVDDSAASVVRSGGWRRRSDSRSFGGAYRRSETTSARATLQFTGRQVGLIGRVGPRGGTAQVQIDADPAVAIQTYAVASDYRQLLFLGPVTQSAGGHVIEVRNGGTTDRPLVEIDAFVVLEAAT